MKRKWKIVITLAAILVAAAGVYASTVYSRRGVVTVQTSRVVREDLVAQVTASGEIKPKNYINIGANAMGDITELLVKEGDHVRKGQLLAKIEDVQPAADVSAQKATLASAEADSSSAEAAVKVADENIKTMQAALDHDKADLARMKADFDRSTELYNEKLLAKQDYELKKYTYEGQVAAIQESQTRLVQSQGQRQQAAAQLAGAQKRVAQAQAGLVRVEDILYKHNAIAPLDGVVTNLPVRVGENVVPGVQNSEGSTIMTIADMSVITAEVKVDETDIVNIRLNQVADISIDAIPNKTFKGHVTEIGDTAILRSTGQAASESAISSQEAKDFKVVIAMDNPPDEIRPGLSCTAKITTAQKSNVVAIPIEALVMRDPKQLKAEEEHPGATVSAATTTTNQPAQLVQGAFVVSKVNGKDRVHFVPVTTGITGATDIEVLKGLKPGDRIVTGTYRVLRDLKQNSLVKEDTSLAAPQNSSSSSN